MKSLTAKPIGKYRADWGEGPIWHDGKLWYVDIRGHKVACLDATTGAEQQWNIGEEVGTIVPTDTADTFLLAGETGIYPFTTADGRGEAIANPEATLGDRTRFNDGKCDPAGRFWAGTLSRAKQPEAALYMLDHNGTLHQQLHGITNSNGICWSHDHRRMFYIDTPTKKVSVFDFDNATGTLANRQTLVDTAAENIPGVPDGMAIDSDDNLWVAFCHGSCVVQFHHTSGEPMAKIDLPVKEPTACAFGGSDLTQLYITTGLPAEDIGALDGSVFVCKPGVRGTEAFAYKEKP